MTFEELEEKRRTWVRSVERVEELESVIDEKTRALAEARGKERLAHSDLRIAAARARARGEVKAS